MNVSQRERNGKNKRQNRGDQLLLLILMLDDDVQEQKGRGMEPDEAEGVRSYMCGEHRFFFFFSCFPLLISPPPPPPLSSSLLSVPRSELRPVLQGGKV